MFFPTRMLPETKQKHKDIESRRSVIVRVDPDKVLVIKTILLSKRTTCLPKKPALADKTLNVILPAADSSFIFFPSADFGPGPMGPLRNKDVLNDA